MVYIFPKSTSATNISFSYCFPSLEELRNLMAVGPIVCSHVNCGGWYTPFPPKSTNLLGSIFRDLYSYATAV